APASEKPRSCPASPATLYRTWMPTTAPGRLVLASASPRRRELLGAVGLGFDLAPADLDEEALSEGLAPEASALAVAAAKAAARAAGDGVVLAADTSVVLGGAVFGKPRSDDGARRMLASLGGRDHEVITAVVVRAAGVERRAACHSTVRMRDYTAAEIAAYVAGGGGRDKAGAYGIQDVPLRPVESIDRCSCNVLGLPVGAAARLLGQAGRRAPRRPGEAVARRGSCPPRADRGGRPLGRV